MEVYVVQAEATPQLLRLRLEAKSVSRPSQHCCYIHPSSGCCPSDIWLNFLHLLAHHTGLLGKQKVLFWFDTRVEEFKTIYISFWIFSEFGFPCWKIKEQEFSKLLWSFFTPLFVNIIRRFPNWKVMWLKNTTLSKKILFDLNHGLRYLFLKS